MLSSEEMTCRELVDLVTAYLDGTLPTPERARFDAHIESCPYCVRYIEQMRRTTRLLGRLSEETIDPAARDELLRRFADWHRS